MNHIFDILKGAVVGLANVVPGVSGGTMMVSMGIYDNILRAINQLTSQFRKSIAILWPYLLGMVLAIVAGSFVLKAAFANFPLPTNTLFVGLIIGGIPVLLKEMKGCRIGAAEIISFILLFGVVIAQKVLSGETVISITLTPLEVIKICILGALASAAMVVPGVSGSMLLKSLGYYQVIVTESIPGLVTGLTGGDFGTVLHCLGILLPYVVGLVIGLLGAAKLITLLLERFHGPTCSGILGMVLASCVTIMMDSCNWASINAGLVIAAVITLAVGIVIALRFGAEKE